MCAKTKVENQEYDKLKDKFINMRALWEYEQDKNDELKDKNKKLT